jgi:hypothetical protein
MQHSESCRVCHFAKDFTILIGVRPAFLLSDAATNLDWERWFVWRFAELPDFRIAQCSVFKALRVKICQVEFLI